MSSPEPTATPPQWFQRHPALTLLGVTSVGVVLVIALMELGLRVVSPHPPMHRNAVFGERAIRLREYRPLTDETRAALPYNIERKDGLTAREVIFSTDADGFIRPSEVHASPDRKVLFLGGSTTACELVVDSLRFPALVATRLGHDLGLRVNTYNAGVAGNHALHSLDALVAKGIPLNPDVAVMMHAINDLTTIIRTGGYWGPNHSRGLILPSPCKTLGCRTTARVRTLIPNLWYHLSPLLRPRRREFPSAGSLPDSTAAVRMFRSAVVSFVATAESWGIEPVLMTQANRFGRNPDPTLLEDFDEDAIGVQFDDYSRLYAAFNDVTRSVAAEREVRLIDLDAAFRSTPEYLYDYVHLNDAGSVRAAEIIADALADIPAVRDGRSREAPRPPAILGQ